MGVVRRRLSLQARQMLAAGLALVAFLGLTGYALDRAFAEAALTSQRERLENFAKAYLNGAEVLRSGAIVMPQVPPDPRFDRPGSGLYAGMVGEGLRWESASSLGRILPPPVPGSPGVGRFEGPLPATEASGRGLAVYRYSLTTIWETGRGDIELTLALYEDAAYVGKQVAVYRRTLWGWLGAAAVVLALVQALALRWSLRPLLGVEKALADVQQGSVARLTDEHPRELQPLTDSINALIDSERRNLEQVRRTLGDLAHSLKTPLAVLQSLLDAGASPAELRAEVRTQVQRMNDIVGYQLSRAARSGHVLFAAPLKIEGPAEEIVQGLEKIYAAKGVLCEFEIDPAARFHGELGDLQELLGNLLENAFKWAKSRVVLQVSVLPAPAGKRSGLVLAVDDDGPGIPEDQVERVLQRGVRGDERVQGHGIGLSIVLDIVAAYQGALSVERSPELGGARFVARFPPQV
ncbi:ATP-binding protein [Silanimonas lenta]|uniref:ATP-binding protein n=1 Tax=Silanimonas lenta TaxID=265429 RepID=UPI00041458D6|nr:ATP-binding protein [Silanimonas lenta]